MAETQNRDHFDRWFQHQVADREAPPIHAATVVVLRDTDAGIETLMLRKNAKITFGGAWVFPGGKLDAQDYGPDEDAYSASAAAAVREAKEEGDIDIDASALVRYSHWMPPKTAPKVFSTWFFLAGAPVGAVTIDDGEITEHGWVTPAGMLERHSAGEVDLAPPTWVTLNDLTQHSTVAEALAAADAATPEFFVTRIARTEAGTIAMWTGDVAYESGEATTPGPRHRLMMFDGGWRYERTA